ncbi:polyribonucleotide nucleotidyltransferase [endosymbiont of Pachyrhynchus infernalis]|uniref:polyribonucleotide nucleotidyltransferase n=1 Tax=endosymbiont of Pachyrhynchus infernalis TaxID=1971488 RepID=UPI000DC71F90|nr:polyribonucleotide nucleotidyltransferase [endosymbiont of Pachyrhynchus infernalis]BBA84958.1 polyribonucleotide nucleotidyltransferase [endosymbiont of Pachyrhynchus infernalis]
MFYSFIKEFKYCGYSIKIEIGNIARQATSSLLISANDTSIIISIVENNKNLLNQNILPLTVNYYERAYASGKFPENFLRREFKLSENEIIMSRLIDRSIRPLFSKNYFNEIQITLTVLSLDPDVNLDIISIIGVSTALSISNIPFNGPIGVSKIGYINNELVLNPNNNDLKNSELDLLISGTLDSITMIELSSNFLEKKIILDAIKLGKKNYSFIIDNINDIKNKININNNLKEIEYNNDISLYNLIYDISYDKFNIAYSIENKNDRLIEIIKIKNNILDQIINILSKNQENNILININNVEKDVVRNKIINNKVRIDGRNYDSIRDISINIGILKRVHGSSIFTRGYTQSLASITLGSEKNGIENSNGIIDNFLFHYNFPPYCVGEIGNYGFPKRREIGHGKLAKKSLIYTMPKFKDFPYSIRVVSEIMESDGSSSMASVCSASLALMDSGVPIKSHIAGIAMGLIKNNNDNIILSDISGNEDNFGDMDMKVSGINNKITSIQMDVKNGLISIDIIDNILDKALISINKIIDIMNSYISCPRKKLSKFAPKIFTINIDKSKIKDVIGKGGSTIKSIMNDTKSLIDINDCGFIKIYSNSDELGKKAINKIINITSYIKNDKIYKGIITKIISNIGILVYLENKKKEGLIKLTSNKLVKNNINSFKIGQEVYVKILNIEKNGKMKLLLNNN